MKRRVLVYDDDPDRLKHWVESLRGSVTKGFRTEPVTDEVFEQTVRALQDRQLDAREHEGALTRIACYLDDVDIFLVDFDLLELQGSSDTRRFAITGEEVAYLARCFSTCKVVIVLNRFGQDLLFDLTLRGHPESPADLDVTDKEVSNPGLWSEKWEEYRPSYWPRLDVLVGQMDERVRELAGQLEAPVLSFFGLDLRDLALPRAVLEQIVARGDANPTFEAFVRHSGQCLRPKDKGAKLPPEQVARIAAARVGRWLEGVVLPGQDLLVDAPHLVDRFPSLYTGRNKDKLAREVKTSRVAIDPCVRGRGAFERVSWLTRPAFWWPRIRSDEGIVEVRAPWDVRWPEEVFCEDTSRFEPKADTHEFLSNVHSSFKRRRVLHLPGVSYRPSTRILSEA